MKYLHAHTYALLHIYVHIFFSNAFFVQTTLKTVVSVVNSVKYGNAIIGI